MENRVREFLSQVIDHARKAMDTPNDQDSLDEIHLVVGWAMAALEAEENPGARFAIGGEVFEPDGSGVGSTNPGGSTSV